MGYFVELHNDRRKLGDDRDVYIPDLRDEALLRAVLARLAKRYGQSPSGCKIKVYDRPGGYVKKELHG